MVFFFLIHQNEKDSYEYNQWNYFGPTVKDCDRKVRVVAKCLCCAETNDMYAWGLQQLENFEPRYQLSSTRFLFTDNLVTGDLVVQLGINTTYTLPSDHYHLIANVFPEFFGDYIYFQTDLQQLLKIMLTGDKEEWENGYEKSKVIVQTNNWHFEYLHKIHLAPKKYSMWWLRKHIGNFGCKVSVSAEQNHASGKKLFRHWFYTIHFRKCQEAY